MGKPVFNRIVRYFFRGVLIVVPLSITIYILVSTIIWLDGLLNIPWPGVGLVGMLLTITVLGYLTTFFITRPVFVYFERAILRIPFVSMLYSSMKDLVGAFVGDEKKFDRPVAVQLDDSGSLFKMGFITCEDLGKLDMKDLVSVYLPHSYNFSGNQYLVPRSHIKELDMNGTDAMKFIVSGGVSGIGK